MRDLYISAFAPTLGTGRQLRTYTTIAALARLGAVDGVYIPFEGEAPCREYLALDDVRFHEIRSTRGLRRAGTYAKALGRGAPGQWARGASPELADAAERMAAQPDRGRVIIGDPYCASALVALMRRRSLIYNAHNVESDHRHEDHAAGWLTWRAVRRFERRLLRRAAETWMVSRTDMATAGKLEPAARLRYVPNAVDTDVIRPVVPRAGSDRILMVGNYDWAPNREGLSFFVDEVLPLVWRRRPAATLRVVGRGTSAALAGADPRVQAAGFVDDLAEAYGAADCVVVPLMRGGGTPTKFVEALAYAVPVVATPLAARALELRPGEHFGCGATAEAFAEQVVGVLRDGAPRQAAAGRALVEREFSVDTVAERIAA